MSQSLIDRSVYMGGLKGDLYFNWTDNTSILSQNVGSISFYSSVNASVGLWDNGKPNAISITVDRIGYVTTSNGSVSVYKDEATKRATAAQLSDYEDGFLYNNVVSAAKLSEANLFDAIPMNQRVPRN